VSDRDRRIRKARSDARARSSDQAGARRFVVFAGILVIVFLVVVVLLLVLFASKNLKG
jgi:hypothetical protein